MGRFKRKKKVIIFCAQCNKPKEIYLTKRKERNFCNGKCKGKWDSKNRKGKNSHNWKGKITVYCAQCNKPKEIYPCDQYKEHYFCNQKCMGEWRTINLSGANSSKWKNRITVFCAQCGKPKGISNYPSNKKNKNGRFFCNKKCQYQWQGKNFWGENSPNWQGGKTIVYCTQCGKPKEVRPHNKKEYNFCNKKCWYKWKSENICGAKHPQWKGGIAAEPYCDIWLDKDFKQSIRDRDNNECQNPDCWKTSDKLCGHHIDYDKKNCNPWNVITICFSCNSRANANRKYWTKFYQDIMSQKYGYKYD